MSDASSTKTNFAWWEGFIVCLTVASGRRAAAAAIAIIPSLPPPQLLRFPSPISSLIRFFHSSTPSLCTAARAAVTMGQAEELWPASRVRDTFTKFFEGKKHVNWRSSPVVPLNDPTLLFANAGSLLTPFVLVLSMFMSMFIIIILKSPRFFMLLLLAQLSVQILVPLSSSWEKNYIIENGKR